MGSRTVVDRPLAVVDAVNTAPVAYWVSVEHLNRPIKMTNAAKTSVWDAVWQPWGGIHSITGSATLNTRFPGQWYQIETGLHYNWHRSYDPPLGRYTQPDPLGFVDGPSVYGYAAGSPMRFVDRDGRLLVPGPIGVAITITMIVIELVMPGPPDYIEKHKEPYPIPQPPGEPDRTLPWPDPVPKKWVCNSRADCDDNKPGNCPADPFKKFAFGRGVANDMRGDNGARNLAKSDATHKLGCKPKHVSCKCVGPGEPCSGGC
jgi:RHS repeat-associated protein